MYPNVSVNLGNLILSFAETLDLAAPSLALHQMKSAFIAWELAKAAGLERSRQEVLFLAAVLHDIGALSVEEKISLHSGEVEHTDLHCCRGHALFQSNTWLEPAAEIVRHHHRDWQNWHEPITTPLVFDTQILRLADHLERQIDRQRYILHQDESLRDGLRQLTGTAFNRDIVDLFMQSSKREEFWLDLASPRLYTLLLRNGPFRRLDIDIPTISVFGELICSIVDFKSRFTATHSSGVAHCARILAELASLSNTEVQLMEIAGLLHDLGKLVVPNSILEKPGALTRDEFAVIRQHTYFTFSVLSSIRGLEMVAEWAAYHHEKMNGTGYPFRRQAGELNIGARIMAAADIFTALAENRPYRDGMAPQRIGEIMNDLAGNGTLDPRVVKLLSENVDSIRKSVIERQAQARENYERRIASCAASTPSL